MSFFVSMAVVGIGMKTFLRRTFDEVREVTRRVCIVRLLPLLQLFENFANLALPELLTRGCEEKIAREVSSPSSRCTRSNRARSGEAEVRIYFCHGARDSSGERYSPPRNFLHYVNLRAKWTAISAKRRV